MAFLLKIIHMSRICDNFFLIYYSCVTINPIYFETREKSDNLPIEGDDLSESEIYNLRLAADVCMQQ